MKLTPFIFLLSIFAGLGLAYFTEQTYYYIFPKEEEPKSTYCEANQIKEFYRLRTYQFHAGEINAQGYKDSLYKDLQTHFIMNK